MKGLGRKLTGLTGFLAAATVATVGFFAPTAVEAQGFRGGMMEAMRPTYSSDDLRILSDVFELSDDQRIIIQVLIDDYSESFRAGAAVVREEMETIFQQLRDGGNRENWREMIEKAQAPLEAWRKKADNLNNQFLADFKATLTEPQVERWPTFERRMRREKGMPQGALSGERVDLFKVVDSMDLKEYRDQIDPVLETYAVQLDEALRQRESDMQRAEQDIRQAMQNMDFDKGLAAIDRQSKLRMRIRDTNEMFAQQIRGVLPQALGDEFYHNVLEAGYPQVYNDTWGQRLFEAALNLPDIDETLRGSIDAFRTAHEQRLAAINDRLTKAIRENEPKQLQRQIRMMQARMNNERPQPVEDPVRDLMRERSDMEQLAATQLRSLLTDAQWEKLPRREERMRDGGGPGGQFRGGQQFGGGQQRGGGQQPQRGRDGGAGGGGRGGNRGGNGNGGF